MPSGIPLLDAFVRVRFDGSAALSGLRSFQAQFASVMRGAAAVSAQLSRQIQQARVATAQAQAQAAAVRVGTAQHQTQAAAVRATTAAINQQAAAMRLANLQARTQAAAQRAAAQAQAAAARQQSAARAAVFSTGIVGSVRRMSEIAGGIVIARGIQATADALGNLSSSLVTTNSQLEMYRISMGTLLRDQPRANSLIEEIRSMAAATPFRFDNLTAGVQQFLGIGMSPEESMDMMRVVGDTAAASTMGPEALPRLVRAMSQMMSFGKVNAQDMRQISELGIPGWQILADKMGISISQLRQMSAQGKLTGESLTLMIEGLKERYGGMMEAQSHTFAGLMERMKDTAGIALQKIGEPLFNALKGALESLGTWVSSPAFGAAIEQARQFMVGFVEGLKNTIKWLWEAKGTIATFLEVWIGFEIINVATRHFGPFVAIIAGLIPKMIALGGPLNILIGLMALVAAGFIKAAADGSTFGEAVARIVADITGIDNALSRLDPRTKKEGKTNQRFADVEQDLLHMEEEKRKHDQPPPPGKTRVEEAREKAEKFFRDKEKAGLEEAAKLFGEKEMEKANAVKLRKQAEDMRTGANLSPIERANRIAGQFTPTGRMMLAIESQEADNVERQAKEADMRASELEAKRRRIMDLTNQARTKAVEAGDEAEFKEQDKINTERRLAAANAKAAAWRKQFIDPFFSTEKGQDGKPIGVTARSQSHLADLGSRLAQGLRPVTDGIAGAVGVGVEFAGAKTRDALAGDGQAVLAKMGIDTAALTKDKATKSHFEAATAAIAAQLGIDPGSIRDQVLKDKNTQFVGLAEMNRQIQSGLGTKKPEEKMATFLEMIAKDGVKVKNMPPRGPATAAA